MDTSKFRVVRMGGYDKQDVQAYVEDMKSKIDALEKKVKMLEEDNERLEFKLRKAGGGTSAEDEQAKAALEARVQELEGKCSDYEQKLEEAKNKIVDFYTNSVARYGMTLEAYLSTMGMDKEKFMLTIQDEAANTARTDILTNYIIEKENLNANEEEINAQVQLIKNYYHLTDDKLEELLKDHKEDIKNDITKEKVAEFLLKNND